MDFFFWVSLTFSKVWDGFSSSDSNFWYFEIFFFDFLCFYIFHWVSLTTHQSYSDSLKLIYSWSNCTVCSLKFSLFGTWVCEFSAFSSSNFIYWYWGSETSNLLWITACFNSFDFWWDFGEVCNKDMSLTFWISFDLK